MKLHASGMFTLAQLSVKTDQCLTQTVKFLDRHIVLLSGTLHEPPRVTIHIYMNTIFKDRKVFFQSNSSGDFKSKKFSAVYGK